MADTFFLRMIGLLDRESLLKGEGLVLTHCQQIHMIFMRFAIDVIFVDQSYQVVGLVKNIPPFGLSPVFWKANVAIELPVGVIEKSQTELEDILEFVA